MSAHSESGAEARTKLMAWFQDLLERSEDCWNSQQRDFLDSLLIGQEGTKTLAELAVTSARIKASGLKPDELGSLQQMYEAIEAFWNNPCPQTYENLRTAGQSLETQ